MNYSIIPDSAPFTSEQRAWLNGFLAGWIGLDPATRRDGASPPIAFEASPPASAADVPDESFPWHDPNLTIVTRLELAEGRPLERRLMAAMAQLDCGACGYVCKTYSEAIAAGAEKNLSLCSPGGKNTAKAIKQLLKESGATGNGSKLTASNGHAAHGQSADNVYHRNRPFLARLKSTHNLNQPGSAKYTSHVVIDLSGSGIAYRAGDALGVYPTNSPELVDAILDAAGLAADTIVVAPHGREETLRDALRHSYCLRSAPAELMELLAQTATNEADRTAVTAAITTESYEELDVLDALRLAPSVAWSAPEFLSVLPPMAPRLYSISSSPNAHPDEVHLTVGRVSYEVNGRRRLGVASSMFADRLKPGDAVGVFVHAASDFTVPADPAAPMIMVGPGTGVAPFRAFLEERQATGAPGKNWLIFGDQCEATDFLYRDEFAVMQASGHLSRLDTAFSRDQERKIYVQDRLRENGDEVFTWLQEGAYFFVCGDARRMAVDVDRALHEVIATYGAKSDEDAAAYVRELKRAKRYVRDVY